MVDIIKFRNNIKFFNKVNNFVESHENTKIMRNINEFVRKNANNFYSVLVILDKKISNFVANITEIKLNLEKKNLFTKLEINTQYEINNLIDNFNKVMHISEKISNIKNINTLYFEKLKYINNKWHYEGKVINNNFPFCFAYVGNLNVIFFYFNKTDDYTEKKYDEILFNCYIKPSSNSKWIIINIFHSYYFGDFDNIKGKTENKIKNLLENLHYEKEKNTDYNILYIS